MNWEWESYTKGPWDEDVPGGAQQPRTPQETITGSAYTNNTERT